MIVPEKRWRILNSDSEKAGLLFRELKIYPVLCSILVQRGIDTYEKAKQFFRPSLNDLHDPFLMKDMDKAVQRILSAFSANEKILVFGDYDVDGTTSVACMLQFLKTHHPFVDFYIISTCGTCHRTARVGVLLVHGPLSIL